jgi:hypothetical protein
MGRPAAFKVAVVSPRHRHRHNLESFHQPLNQVLHPSPLTHTVVVIPGTNNENVIEITQITTLPESPEFRVADEVGPP